MSPREPFDELLELREELEAVLVPEPFVPELLAAEVAEPDPRPEDTLVLVDEEAVLCDEDTLDDDEDAFDDDPLALAVRSAPVLLPRVVSTSQLASARAVPVSPWRSSTCVSRPSGPQWTWA